MAAPNGFVTAFSRIFPGTSRVDIDALWDEIEPFRGKGRGGRSSIFDKDDAEYAKRIREEAEKISGATRAIEEHWTHQKDIMDEIVEESKELNKLQNEYARKHQEIEDSTDLTKDEKEIQYAQLDLELAKQKLRVTELEQRKKIEGYNHLDRYEANWKNRTNQFKKGINEISDGVKKIGDGVMKALGPWTKMSQAAADYAKNIGLSGKAMDALRKSTIDMVANRNIGIRYNVSVEELMGLRQNFVKGTGRQISATDNDLETLAATSKILGDNATEFMARLENFGVSMEDAGSRAGKMFATASKRGIAWENYSKNFLDNISLAQRYTFKNGTRGLESMARKATEINLNMSQAAAFADKVSTVEGAITTGAQLQVLGGPFAQMADPIGMLYEGLSDLEGLQDRMVQMFGNLGKFNRQTGEVELSSFNRQRVLAAANSMGLDASNIFESINSNARRNEIARQLQGNANVNEETADLIKNVATIKNGQAGVEIGGVFKKVSELTNADSRYLTEIARSESDDVKDIAQRLRGWDDSVQGFSKQKDAVHAQVVESMGIGKGIQNLINTVGEMHNLLKIMAYGTIAAGVAGVVGGGFSMIKGGSHVVGGTKNIFSNTLGRSLATSVEGGKMIATDGTVLREYTTGGKGLARLGQMTSESGGRMGLGKRMVANNAAYNATKFAKGANIAGLAGLGVTLATNAIVGSNKNLRGGGLDYAGNMIGNALSMGATGAQLGSFLGPIGTAVGGIIGIAGGALVGGLQARTRQLYRHIDEAGITLSGKYSRKELKEIRDAARGGGEVSAKLREKMEKNGDLTAVQQLEEIKKNVFKVKVVGAEKKATGGIVGGNEVSGDRNVVMTNSREMVLTQGQQATLFNAIKENNFAKLTPEVNIKNIEPGLPNITPNFKVQTNVMPRQDYSVIQKPLQPTPQPMRIEFGNMNINFKGDDINLLDGNGNLSKANIDTEKLKKSIEQSIMLSISEQLSRLEHGGRYVPDKGYLYQQG